MTETARQRKNATHYNIRNRPCPECGFTRDVYYRSSTWDLRCGICKVVFQ